MERERELERERKRELERERERELVDAGICSQKKMLESQHCKNVL